MNEKLPKMIVVLGPTASGKTNLGLKLAAEFNGEIISADSRQVYTKMNIGTAKPEGDWSVFEGENRFLVDGIPHYLMDIIDPGKVFTMADFQKMAFHHIDDIVGRGKIPIMVGGTGLYIWSVVDNLSIPKGGPLKKLRASFEKKSHEELITILNSMDKTAAAYVDTKNKRRVIRALELMISSGEPLENLRKKHDQKVEALQVGLHWPMKDLYERIERRVEEQWEAGLVREVKKLMGMKYSFELSSMSGIGYRQIGYFLRGEMTEREAKERLKRDTRQYARRQMTWFKRDKRIKWIEQDNIEEAKKLVTKFIK